MIVLDSVTYTYSALVPGEPRITALDRVSLHVRPGQCVAVTGANGSGKTTLCLTTAGLAPRLTEGRIEHGQIMVAGHDVQSAGPGALADLIGLVMEDPAGQIFNPTIADEIAWGLENLGVPRGEMDGRIVEALAMVGLSNLPLNRAPNTLSGGEQKRLALACALALQPKVLILDEPSGGLAPSARMEMMNTLKRLRMETQLTILIAESNPEVIAALADRVIILDQGQVVMEGTPEEVYSTIDRSRLPGVPIPAISLFTRVLYETSGLEIPTLTVEELARSLPAAHPPRMELPATEISTTSEPAIELDAVRFSYHENAPVLKGVDLHIPRGQFAVLAGDNGAGKTTLARHLIGLLRPQSGSVRILSTDIAGMSIGQVAREVGFAFQSPELQIFNPKVRDEIAFGPRNLGVDKSEVEAMVDQSLDRFGLRRAAEHPPAALSFSERRMVALASIAAMHTPVIVVDEPTVGLDASGQAAVLDWLYERHREGATILLITHDMEIAAACAERLIIVSEGHVAADGPPEEVFRQREVLAQAGLEAPFAVRLSEAIRQPHLAAHLTPQRAARAWLETYQGQHG